MAFCALGCKVFHAFLCSACFILLGGPERQSVLKVVYIWLFKNKLRRILSHLPLHHTFIACCQSLMTVSCKLLLLMKRIVEVCMFNPLAHAATSTVHSTCDCMHKGETFGRANMLISRLSSPQPPTKITNITLPEEDGIRISQQEVTRAPHLLSVDQGLEHFNRY